jgi:hypothetical protein
MSEYTCAMCNGTFEKEVTDEEQIAEFETIFGQSIDAEPVDIVCHDCWLAMGLDKVGAHRA